MSLILKLTDAQDSVVYDLLEVPFAEKIVDGGIKTIETADGNVSTYFGFYKRIWEHQWAYMSADEYKRLRGFYDRQFTNYKYPLMTVTGPNLAVENMPVQMSIGDKNTISNCGMVQGVKITLRETRQMGG